MKFNTTKLHPSLLSEPKVGNIYTCKGGSSRTSPHVWIVVGIKNDQASLLGVDKEGDIISATKYGLYTIRRWAVIGNCLDIDKLELNLEMF